MEELKLGMGTFGQGPLPESVELKLAMVLVLWWLIQRYHGFRQIRIFAAAFHAPGAKIRAFR